jgi:hypothetical protein
MQAFSYLWTQLGCQCCLVKTVSKYLLLYFWTNLGSQDAYNNQKNLCI